MNSSGYTKFYLIAGERSGDLHGGNLIDAVKQREPTARFRGFGGDEMNRAGMEIVVHYRDMAFMGLVDVLFNIRTIFRNLRKCKDDILHWKPDILILIDYAGFNLRIARFARSNNIRVFWYISPKVWAWNQKRALKLKASVDRMFVILPFEAAFYKKFDWKVDYVGNPVMDAVRKYKADSAFPSINGLDPKRTIAVLPGSRKQELIRILPVLNKVFMRCNEVMFAVSVVDNLDQSLYETINAPNARLIKGDTYGLLSHSVAAIVTSGTATLEAALFRVPQVVVYRTGRVSYAIGSRIVKVDFISLVNLIAEREVVRELLQDDANVESISEEVLRLTEDAEYRNKIMEGYDEVISRLDKPSASDQTARLMLQYLRQ